MDQTRSLESFLAHVQQRDPHQSEFAQAVREVMTTLWPFLEENPRYRQMALLERLGEPSSSSAWRGWTTAIRCRSTARGACSLTPPLGRLRAGCASILR